VRACVLFVFRVQPAIDFPMFQLGYGHNVVRRLDPRFGDTVLSRPSLDDVMLVVAWSNVVAQILGRLRRADVRVNIRIGSVGPIGRFHGGEEQSDAARLRSPPTLFLLLQGEQASSPL